jgi:DNA uptake protein ComE-like DNA-binding protein
MRSIKNQIKSFFHFNKKQENAVFALIFILIILFLLNYFLPRLQKEKTYDYSAALQEIEEWQSTKVQPKQKTQSKEKYGKDKADRQLVLKPFPFDPNKLSRKKWLAMGMPKPIVQIILNYRKKGGKFKEREDLKKIYGLTPKMYSSLKDYIQIPENNSIANNKKIEKPKKDTLRKVIPILDINTADSASLLQVPGIGPFYASQIVKYRKRLGGYCNMNQLKELYKMDSNRFYSISSYLKLEDSLLTPINLNSVDFKRLVHHPYVDYHTAKKIVQLRNKLGRFASLIELKKDSVLSEPQYQKLKMYFKVN